MRKFLTVLTLVPAVLAFTLAPFVLSGCGKEDRVAAPEIVTEPAILDDGSFVVHGTVLENGTPRQASILVLWDGREEEIRTSSDGSFRIQVDRSPKYLIAATLGKSAILEGPFRSDRDYRVTLTAVDVLPRSSGPATTLSEYWFGVYDTDSHGDVRFRYQYAFSRFLCINWMPYLGEGGPNPNNWTSWSISDFPPPWSGKRLLVPQRYQTYHRWVYGYSISGALYLIAVR